MAGQREESNVPPYMTTACHAMCKIQMFHAAARSSPVSRSSASLPSPRSLDPANTKLFQSLKKEWEGSWRNSEAQFTVAFKRITRTPSSREYNTYHLDVNSQPGLRSTRRPLDYALFLTFRVLASADQNPNPVSSVYS